MKNYRELQNALARSLENLKVERKRAENLFNDLSRYLEGNQGVPKECVFFVLIQEGRDPVISQGAGDFVSLEEERTWSCNLVLRIHETGPRGETTHVLLNPHVAFREEEVIMGIEGVDISDQTIPCPEGTLTTSLTTPLAEMITEAAARRIESIGGDDSRKIGFGA